MLQDKLWPEKYRPSSLDQFIFHTDNQKELFQNIVKSKNIPHLLFSGSCGIGKTTLAKILIKECGIENEDVLIINASDENNVDTIRTKIRAHLESYALGDYKVVLLDEGDYLTLPAQAILRGILEQYDEYVRFIITCNYENKIMPAIKSRCQHHAFKPCDANDIALLVADILIKESVKFNMDTLDKFVSVGYPDIRQTIMLVEQYTIDGKLKYVDSKSQGADYKFAILDHLVDDNWYALRTIVTEQVSSVSEFEDLYRFLYENLSKSKKFKNKDKHDQGIITIAEYLYRHTLVVDAEINFVACLISLNQI